MRRKQLKDWTKWLKSWGELIDKENDLLQGMIGTVNRKA